MRISGGAARGVTLSVPPGDQVRPATDGLRQAVFSSLAARIPDARFVDLFAGSGGYGLEALSRGAAAGFFVEKHARTAQCLRRNLEAVAKSLGRDPNDLARISQADALDWRPPEPSSPAPSTGAIELVFIDPPYEIIESIASALMAHVAAWLQPQAAADPLVIFETPGEVALTPAGWTQVKRIGGTHTRQPGVSVFRLNP